MKHSESIKMIAPAFAKAQAAFKPPLKDSHADAGKFGYSYADLANVFEGARPGLVPNGLFLFAVVNEKDNGKRVLETVLMHESGEYFAMEYPLTMQGTPQQVGSEITYARRYSAMMILGLAGEDDDGASASNKKPAQTQKAGSSATTTQATTTSKPALIGNGTHADGSSGQSSSDGHADTDQQPTDRAAAILFYGKWAKKLIAAKVTHPEHVTTIDAVIAANTIAAKDGKADASITPDEIRTRGKRVMINVCNLTGEIEDVID